VKERQLYSVHTVLRMQISAIKFFTEVSVTQSNIQKILIYDVTLTTAKLQIRVVPTLQIKHRQVIRFHKKRIMQINMRL
jgi:hypothetical protein